MDLSRSQAVTYTVNVVMSLKWCKIATSICCYRPLIGSDVMAYRIAAITITLSDI